MNANSSPSSSTSSLSNQHPPPPPPPPPPPQSMMETTSSAAATASPTATDGSGGNKKVRKPYTITKSRESWTDEEHEKFLEALQLFDRDWKKIEDFVGSKTVIQIRSHAQKYFLKVQKNGTIAHVPPPRPKRKATHPYPQKASKNVLAPLHAAFAYPSVNALAHGYASWDDASMIINSKIMLPQDDFTNLQGAKADIGSKGLVRTGNSSVSGIGSSTRTLPSSELPKQGKVPVLHGIPDFAEVYSFIGSVFDPESNDHVQKLKEMDPINFETVLLLMKNLSVNLSSPDFEPIRTVLSSYDSNTKTSLNDTAFTVSTPLLPRCCFINCSIRIQFSGRNYSEEIKMLQHQIVQSPARLGLTNPNSPSLQNSTPPKFPSSATHHLHHHSTATASTITATSAAATTSTTTTTTTTTNTSAPTSSTLLPLLPPLPRAQALLLQMASLASKLFEVSPNRSLWLSAFRGSLPAFLASQAQSQPPPPLESSPSSTKEIISSFTALQTQLFEAVAELQEILDLQDAKQKIAREVKSKDSGILAFANKIKEAERVLDILVDDYSDYRRPKRVKLKLEDDDMEEDVDDTCTTTVASQLNLSDILSYAHRISYTTFAPPEFGAGGPLRGALPPAPQEEQMRASQLYNFADLDVGLPKTNETKEKKIEAIIEPPPPQAYDASKLSAIQGLLPPNITVPSGWKPGMPVELPKDFPIVPPPGWKPGDAVPLPPLDAIQVPRIDEQMLRPVPPQGLHRPHEPIQDDDSELSKELDYSGCLTIHFAISKYAVDSGQTLASALV
ncbi:hypothetical protein QYF36_005399 [Acer negundo]|nr:hypothetical protein QYF36_005399 [Acer negundo]